MLILMVAAYWTTDRSKLIYPKCLSEMSIRKVYPKSLPEKSTRKVYPGRDSTGINPLIIIFEWMKILDKRYLRLMKSK